MSAGRIRILLGSMALLSDWTGSGDPTMTDLVLIPTRGRWDRLDKIVDAWTYWGFRVAFVTELDQMDAASKFYEEYHGSDNYIADLRILYLEDKVGKGIGHTRNRIVKWADEEGFDAFVMSDDDCFPHSSSVHI